MIGADVLASMEPCATVVAPRVSTTVRSSSHRFGMVMLNGLKRFVCGVPLRYLIRAESHDLRA